MNIRLENKKDYNEVENVIREAFWDVYKPGCDEHFIVHNLRDLDTFIKELDFVACDSDLIVGNIIYSKARVINDKNEEFEVLCMGPIAVLPPYQRKGIGSLLINHSIKIAKTLGYNAVILFGNPSYYHRFGFVNAEKFHIKTSWGTNMEEFMALELHEGALDGITGKFYEDPVFEPDKNELEHYDKQFPYKEKHVTDTQLK